MFTVPTANKNVIATRTEKRAGVWSLIPVKKLMLIDDYNYGMQGVDRSDQLISSNNVWMKCVRWWKTLFFFHCIDIAVVNSWIIFEEHHQPHPTTPKLHRNANFDQLSFWSELTQLLETDADHVPWVDPARKDVLQHPRRCQKGRTENVLWPTQGGTENKRSKWKLRSTPVPHKIQELLHRLAQAMKEFWLYSFFLFMWGRLCTENY